MIKYYRTLKIFCWIALVSLLILTTVFFLIQKKSKDLDRSRIALIDIVGNNYIFRGNNPFTTTDGKKSFAHDELTLYFNGILLKEGRKPLGDYYFIDISLLDLDEYYIIKKEEAFFKSRSNHINMMLNISTISPSLLLKRSPDSNMMTRYLTDNYSSWVTETLTKIHEMASRQTDKPIVIYIHCNGGRDRTGLISAGYRMLFQNTNLSEAQAKNIKEVGRNSGILYNNAIESYCLHVKESFKKSDDYCD